MSTSTNRLSIVQRALKQAGRGVEIRAHVNELLNVMLRSWAIESKYPQLRKIGAALTLNAGANTVSLPSDFGFGMDNLMFGDERRPLIEQDADAFMLGGGIEDINATAARPTGYMIDKQADQIRFNRTAEKAYSMIPVYFFLPAGLTSDTEFPWYDDDMIVEQGLVAMIYQYTEDEREISQFQKVVSLKKEFRRGIIPLMGGSTKMRLAKSTFKRSVRNRRLPFG